MSLFALVHSPLVGASTWGWVAGELRNRGHRSIVPVVTSSVVARGWEAFVTSVVAQISDGEPVILVGHSGAGPLLPQIAARLTPPVAGLVFVDAAIPPAAGDTTLLPEEMLGHLEALATDGILPRWSEWFGPDIMDALVPDVDVRSAVKADLPQLPLHYFKARVPVPPSWDAVPCGYVLLSHAYEAELSRARDLGWPNIELPGGHLDIVNSPVEVTDAVLLVADVHTPLAPAPDQTAHDEPAPATKPDANTLPPAPSTLPPAPRN